MVREDNRRVKTARRGSIRLEGYDYASPGAYFVTFCTAHRKPLFGRMAGDRMVENRNAKAVRRCWSDLPYHYPHVRLDAFVVMPDHVHGIVVLGNARRTDSDRAGDARAGSKPAPTRGGTTTRPGVRHGLPEVVRALKTLSARQINAARGTPGAAVWQRHYYERIIRDAHALKRIREYIRTNPQQQHRQHANP